MKTGKISLLLSLLFVIACQSPSLKDDSNYYKLHVTLENAPFDSLYLRDYTVGRDLLIAGKKTQAFTWEIIVPDSIVWDFETMELVVSPYDSTTFSSRKVRFLSERDGKKIIVANVGLEDKNSYILATFVDESVFTDKYSNIIDGKDSVTIETQIYEDFQLILQDDDSDIRVRVEDPFFSWFADFKGEGISYDDFLTSYYELSKKYPHSRFLMTNLATNLKQYKSKEDAKRIYDNLSMKHKNTKWAKLIEQFLSGKFENTSLPRLNNDTDEPIIQDMSKFNLVVFSASWCAPCIEEIPLLKEIYNDLNDNLILTFICMDEDSSVPSFQEIIKEKDIPWRTLFAYQDIRNIAEKYVAESIPHNILVHPNGNMEIIDVRKDEDREKLYLISKATEN